MPYSYSPYPVETLEGVGPAIAARLSRWGIIDTHDLLRHSSDRVHKWVRDTASLAMVRQWQVMALFLEIKCMDRQWAEALATGGISSVEELSRAGLEQLQAVFADAQGEHLIREVPDAESILNMVRDATVIHCSGKLSGRITDQTGAPVAAASIRIGNAKACTNERGRFCLLRIPLGRGSPLLVSHETHGRFEIANPPVALDTELHHEHIFCLNDQAAAVGDMDEFYGDRLPPFNGRVVTSKLHDTDAIRDGELLFIESFYKNGEHAKLASWFRTLIDGRFVIRTYKVPISMLPEACDVKATLQYCRSKLIRRQMQHSQIEHYRRVIGALHSNGQLSSGREDPALLLARIKQALRAEARHG
jgi:hypothetical protein